MHNLSVLPAYISAEHPDDLVKLPNALLSFPVIAKKNTIQAERRLVSMLHE